MADGQDTILGTDLVRDAFKVKINDDMAELHLVKNEVVAARTSAVTGTAHASADARLESIEADIEALMVGSGCPVSANDSSPGYLNGKLVAGEGIDLTEGSDGGDETLAISVEDATGANKGILSVDTTPFSITAGALSMSPDANDFTVAAGAWKNKYYYPIIKTADYTITEADCRGHAVFSNYEAAAEVNLLLPPIGSFHAKVGFVVDTAQYLRITAPAGTRIHYLENQTAQGGYIRCATTKSFVFLIDTPGWGWLIYNLQGTWLVDE